MGEESDKDTNMQCNVMESKSTEFVGWPPHSLPNVISFVVYHLKYICRNGFQYFALYTNKYFAKQLDFDLFPFRKMKNNTNTLLAITYTSGGGTLANRISVEWPKQLVGTLAAAPTPPITIILDRPHYISLISPALLFDSNSKPVPYVSDPLVCL